ncbi:alpha/beta hydrolase [Actimicrobium sp. CCC2.4]|uniref:alpha/beta fold hydrolase n=1 Tax=Actimicrobium sp. CCC2.4 TaxID=3048606 RepID=UPI002AC99C98|nr:alpha/beta hydrolase [Actimicrobium sp. CCC2.4]MEB0134221.1 alpha/beta hydrolase [Actimicrobium sp. CCC2.4]WPX32871.1 alpha/beta hydrolase [Actimicrobium sp. CCC2.4]
MSIISRNNVRISGHGQQPIIFAHGFGCDQVMWRFVSPAFEPDYQVVLFDYVGAGHSDPDAYDPQRYATLDGYALDLVDICEALDLNDVILVGHSVSSMICLLAAKAMPGRIARLVMICPSPRYLNDPPDYHGGFERADIEGLIDMMERNQTGWTSQLSVMVAGNPDRPELADELDANFCAMDPLIARRFAAATFLADNRSDLADVRQPVGILQCSHDIIAPVAVGEYMHRQLPGSILERINAFGHCPQLSHPQETIAMIRDYLQRAA